MLIAPKPVNMALSLLMTTINRAKMPRLRTAPLLFSYTAFDTPNQPLPTRCSKLLTPPTPHLTLPHFFSYIFARSRHLLLCTYSVDTNTVQTTFILSIQPSFIYPASAKQAVSLDSYPYSPSHQQRHYLPRSPILETSIRIGSFSPPQPVNKTRPSSPLTMRNKILGGVGTGSFQFPPIHHPSTALIRPPPTTT
ncbi:hypothetical protein BLNAU_24561 [Blattamonas nauphoetae]|uniref:Uncharacterized protein n=1 Tax=Blattamonas nauphoetae TaxID=2049346 RepID=A0ABQ9WMF2_9EUKA|nr:hypothetical protein BLNAU_24561 [Blattamonas nauphoetae]